MMRALAYLVEGDDLRSVAHSCPDALHIIDAPTRPQFGRKAFYVFFDDAVFRAYMRGVLTAPPDLNINTSVF